MKILLALLLCFTAALAQAPPAQQRAMASAWNQLGPSITREDVYLNELTRSLQQNPPWRTLDASQDHAKRRAELIDKIIAEHKLRIGLLETIKKEDNQP